MSDTTINLQNVSNVISNNYGAIAILLSIVSIISTRMYGYTAFFTENGVSITNSELYLNLRNIEYISANWPFVLQTDPYLDYPVGGVNSSGLFDYIAGTLAYFGQTLQLPFEISKILLLVLPIIFIAITAIPVYYTAKEIFNRPIAVGTVLIYPVIPSELYSTSVIGSGSSETLSVLFFFLSLYFITKALKIAELNIITVEVLSELTLDDFTDSLYRATTANKQFIRYSLFATLSVTLLGFSNSYGLFLLTATTLVFTLLYTASRTLYNDYIEPVLVTIPSIFIIPAILHSVTNYVTVFEKLTLVTVFALPVLLLYTNRYLIDSPEEKRNTILNVLYIAIPTAIILAVYAVPQLNTLYTTTVQSLSTTIFNSNASIQLAIWEQYGALVIPATIGMIAFAVRYILTDIYKSMYVLIYSTALVTIIASYYTTLNIYLTPVLAMIASYALYTIIVRLDITTTPVRKYKGYQISTVLLILVLFVPIILYPVSGTVFAETAQDPTIEYQDTSEWLQENTPESGDYVQDPTAEYGIVNNQNSGYKLSYNAERPVVGTSSGENTEGLAEYMTANPSEEDPAQQFTNQENVSPDTFEDRYVVVDWRSVSSEFEYGTYAQQSSESQSDFYQPVFTRTGNYGFSLYTDAYYNSLATKLYHYHGSSVEQSPVVVQTEASSQGFLSVPGDIRRSEAIQTFESMEEAESYVDENGGQIGGVMSNPTSEVSHVENYRLVHLSENSVVDDRLFNQLSGNLLQFNQDLQYSDIIIEPSAVKTYEKVEGATLEGSNAYPESEVVAQVQMSIPNSEQPLVYRATTTADENGNYTLNVPYSTTNFDQYTAEDGYTNPDIRPNEPYTVLNQEPDGQGRKTAQVSVTEGQIYGEEDSTVSVGLSNRLPISIGGGSGANISTQSAG